jgi:hypothetical protein
MTRMGERGVVMELEVLQDGRGWGRILTIRGVDKRDTGHG